MRLHTCGFVCGLDIQSFRASSAHTLAALLRPDGKPLTPAPNFTLNITIFGWNSSSWVSHFYSDNHVVLLFSMAVEAC